MGRFHVLHCVHIRNFEYGKMRMNQGLSVFIGMQMEQGSQEGDYHQQSHRVPRDQFSHKRILTKRSSKVNRPDGSHRACHQITFRKMPAEPRLEKSYRCAAAPRSTTAGVALSFRLVHEDLGALLAAVGHRREKFSPVGYEKAGSCACWYGVACKPVIVIRILLRRLRTVVQQ